MLFCSPQYSIVSKLQEESLEERLFQGEKGGVCVGGGRLFLHNLYTVFWRIDDSVEKESFYLEDHMALIYFTVLVVHTSNSFQSLGTVLLWRWRSRSVTLMRLSYTFTVS